MKQKDFYKTKAWKRLSKLVKDIFSNDEGITQCWTCGKFLLIGTSDCHAGHYIPGHKFRATALELVNIGIQCKKCNTFEGGKPEEMRVAIDKYYGSGTADMLQVKKHNYLKLDKHTLDIYFNIYKNTLPNPRKYSKDELKEIIKKYR